MGIRFRCQACTNKVNVKDFLAGKRGICPKCGARFIIPEQSEPEFQTAAEDAEPDPTPAPTIAAPVAGATTTGQFPQTNTAQTNPTPQYSAPQQPQPAPFAPALPTPGFQAAPSAGPRDPFADAPAAQWYVRHASGQQYGPAPVPTMQKWLSEGRVPGDGMVWREGWSDWQMAALVFPQLSATPTPATRGPIAAPFAPQPGLYPGPAAAAPVEVNDPFAFDTPAGAASPASQFIHQRRDNSRMMLIISIVLLFAIALVGGVLIYVLTRPKATEEVVARAGVQIAHYEIQTNTF